MSRNGFGYVVAVIVLALMAFMGLFLSQSSSAEYSQAAISVYRTMARQLAEAAGEEAFVMLEERFRDKSSTGYFDQLLEQAASSKSPKDGGSTGLNPSLLNDFNNLAQSVMQTLALKNYHITRAGFEIEKILPSIKCCRPIPNLALDNDECYYCPPDRSVGFDNEYSRDWYLVIQLDIRVALKKRGTFKLDYTVSHDVKIINLAPIARNYTMFSILGHNINVADSSSIERIIKNEMNYPPDKPGGRLILWNMPFQSRVYLHGPSIINLENPALRTNPNDEFKGAYTELEPEKATPGINHAYQYSSTFYGLSYFKTVCRAIFLPKNLWDACAVWFRQPTETKGDSKESAYSKYITEDTVYGGILPNKDRGFLDAVKDLLKADCQDDYLTGSNAYQKFLPAGPFCRTPWKYVSEKLIGAGGFHPNSKIDWNGETTKLFPKDDDSIVLEHHYSKDDPEEAKKSQIYAGVNKIRYYRLTNKVEVDKDQLCEFALSYYNNPDPHGFWGKLGYAFSSVGDAVWERVKQPFQVVGMIGSSLKNWIFGKKDPASVSAEAETQTHNLYPSNFRLNYLGAVTRVLRDETAIPRDKNGNWKLDGVYLLGSCQITTDVAYVGTGTIMVVQFNRNRPFKISANIMAERGEGNAPMGHLNIFYHPYEVATDYTDHMLLLEGCHCIEASIYSCFGIRTTDGVIEDMTTINASPDALTSEWNVNFDEVSKRSNLVLGNYVNFYLNKSKQLGDLWIVHNFYNPFYFDKLESDNRYAPVQDRLDSDPSNAERKKYEKMTHSFFMSPKLMHAAVSGGGNSADNE